MLDLCQVGEDPDAFFLKLVTAHPAKQALVETLIELRMLLLHRYGGRGCDFDVHCCVAEESALVSSEGSLESTGDLALDYEFVVTFAPVSAIEKIEGGYTYRNTSAKTLSTDFNIPCQTVDSSQGKGNMMTWGEADWELGLSGRPALERLYDFNALKGAVSCCRHHTRHHAPPID